MKNKDWVIVMLIIVIYALALFSIFQIKMYEKDKRSDNLAIALSQVNNMAQDGSSLIRDINQVLVDNGYGYLQREIVNKTEEE